MEGWKSGFRTFYLSDFISNTQIFAFVLTKRPYLHCIFLDFLEYSVYFDCCKYHQAGRPFLHLDRCYCCDSHLARCYTSL